MTGTEMYSSQGSEDADGGPYSVAVCLAGGYQSYTGTLLTT